MAFAQDNKNKEEDVESGGKTGHPEQDRFREGKIGSGFMSTISGQPHLEEFAVKKKGKKRKSNARRNNCRQEENKS